MKNINDFKKEIIEEYQKKERRTEKLVFQIGSIIGIMAAATGFLAQGLFFTTYHATKSLLSALFFSGAVCSLVGVVVGSSIYHCYRNLK